MWQKFNLCKLSSVDLSEEYKTVAHSFTGTPAEKSAVTAVHFDKSLNIDFLPKEIVSDFPQLNGIIIENCDTFTNVKNELFSEDFGAIQYLDISSNLIETIEVGAFQHLPKLKWIAIESNLIESLPHQIFRNNPEIIFLSFHDNQINSITPDFFKNLNKLQYVTFDENQCTNKEFGCYSGSCLVAQAELDSGLSTCYSNCLSDGECASKSGKLDALSPAEIEKNLDLIISSGHLSTLIAMNYTNQLVEKGHGDLIVEKDSKSKVVQLKNETSECDANLLKVISNKFEEMSKDLKDQKETIESLKQEVADLKTKLGECQTCTDASTDLERKLSEVFKKEFDNFVTNLNEGA
jgi:polyhydroxyalkanoate synthesis regulator phasin